MTMDDLPPPPVPAECDLTGFSFMPLDCVRLVQSDLIAIASGDEFKAAVILWCKSWSNIPAGSLTDDDRVLAHAAGLTTKAWSRVRTMAMHGWYKASDGRLYHPVVSEKAAEAWAHRQRQRDRARKGNAVRWGSPDDRQTIAEGSPARSLNDRKGQGQGQGQGLEDAAASSARAPAAAADPVFGEDRAPPPDIPVVRDKNLGDLQALHPKVYIGRDERGAWQAVLNEYGWEIVAEACRRIGSAIPQGRRILLSVLTGWIAENVKPMEAT